MVGATFALLGLHGAVAWAAQIDAQAPSATRPNLLFLLADDQKCDSIGAYGNPVIQTPHLDRLVHSGFNFHNAYCFGSPHGAVCMPSRAMLHSGRSLFRLQNLNLEGHKLLGEYLAEAGYQTFATGKWHNGKPSLVRSFQRGSNVFLGGMSNHAEVPTVELAADQSFSDVQMGAHFSSKLFADAAVEFLQQRDPEKPFFCYVAFTAPHDPRMSPGNFNRMYRPEEMPVPKNFLPQHPFNIGDLTVRDENLAPWPRTPAVIQQQTSEYYGLVSHLDQQIGRILAALEEQGLLDNTLIVYTADHGLALGSHGLLGKQSLYEHSMKAPLIVAGPGVPVGRTDALVYLHDLFPTLLQWAGVAIPADNEGISLIPAWQADHADQADQADQDDQANQADSTPWPRDVLFTAYKDTIRAVRDPRWKLIRYPQVDRTQLFDLQADPDEMRDLSRSERAEHRDALRRLQAALRDAQIRYGDPHPLTVANPIPAEIDLTGHPRKPDQWQPRWIVEKYFGPTPSK
jgi:arylsulfatase A-like enzyme